ncbi:MAG: YIP1 family protein [Eubacteriales bacterium]|nr:YIP1 family protein [Eubacteriales bacterium]
MFRTKKSRLKTVILGFLALLCLVPNSSLWASEIAQGAAELDDYVYDTKGDPHPAPVAFHHRLSLDSKQLGHPLRGLEDIAVTESKIYLATGQGIYVLDPELRFIEAWDHYEHEGTMRPLREVAGLYANHKGQIYACLPGEGRIVRFNEAGETEIVYGKPEGINLKGADYKPVTVIADRIGRMFVIGQGIYEGIIEIAPTGEFTRFFGVNPARYNPVEIFWRSIATDAQRRQMALWLPTDYSDLALRDDGFIFATVASLDSTRKVQLLNAKGSDILRFPLGRRPQGDRKQRPGFEAQITSIAYAGDGIYAILDSLKKRVFLYNEDGWELCHFGIPGERAGGLKNPRQIAFHGDELLICDPLSQSLEVFEPSEYGKKLIEGCRAEYAKDNRRSEAIWQAVRKQSPYLALTYVSLGNAAYREKDYETAMHYYRRADDRSAYSKAYERIRDRWLSEHFNYIAFGLLFLVVLLVLIHKLRAQRGRVAVRESAWRETVCVYPRYVMSNPFKAFADMKYDGRGSLLFAVTLLLIRGLISILAYAKTGFLMNHNDPAKINTVLIALAAMMPFILLSFGNWASTTLMNGSGKLKEIFMVFMYSQIPLLIVEALLILLSNVATIEELPMLQMLHSFALLFTIILAFIGLVSIHEFSFARGIASIFTTALAVMIILFITLLLASLTGEFFVFLRIIFREISLNRF